MKQIFLIIFSISILTVLSQNSYFVSPYGNNENNGTSPQQAWKSIQFGIDNLSAGDTLNILSGNYTESLTITNSGADANYITIKAFDTSTVYISGENLPQDSFLLKIENKNFIKIGGLNFVDYQKNDAKGILIINSSNIIIENNSISNIDYAPNVNGEIPNENQNSQPIIVFGRNENTPSTNIKILNNTVYNCETGWSEAISLNGNIDGFEISGNHVYNNTNIAIVVIGFEGECPDENLDQVRNGIINNNVVHDNPSSYAECAGIYIDGAANVIVMYNTIYNNNYGIEIGCENNGNAQNNPSANNIIIRNNLIYNNTYTGIAVGGYNYPESGKVENSSIETNTCYNNDTENNYQGEMMISYTENVKIENNIFYTKNTDAVLFTLENTNSSLSINYNAYYTTTNANNIVIVWGNTEYNSFSTYKNATNQDYNSNFANPGFEDITTLNFRLANNSPAIDAGNPSYQPLNAETDFDGNTRIVNNNVDCGAFEYGSTSINKFKKQKTFINIFPNPANDYLIVNNNETVQNISVFTTSGVMLLSENTNEKTTILNISKLKAGIYILVLKVNENRCINRKFVKN